MAELAFTACKFLASQIVDRTKQAVANKADCEQLAKYVVGLQPMLQELEGAKNTPPSAMQNFELLKEALQRCLDLVSQCCTMGWMKALVKACTPPLPNPSNQLLQQHTTQSNSCFLHCWWGALVAMQPT
mmetsp:Transcript_6653/g.18555  ORF Transcript_6653/g.18555 Transcript_6653/m.18555 type:complete len:129 (-) Transcript_6653:205-591(-)